MSGVMLLPKNADTCAEFWCKHCNCNLYYVFFKYTCSVRSNTSAGTVKLR